MHARTCSRHNERDLVASGVAALDRLVEVCLHERLPKDPQIRLSRWSATKLTDAQIAYAVLDAEYSLKVFFYLLSLDNLMLRLEGNDAVAGAAVDVVPSHGNVGVLATRGARATIAESKQWDTPRFFAPRNLKATRTRRLVTVTEVFAPSMIVPGVKNAQRQRLTLGDLGEPPFSVMLPLAMLAPPSTRRRATPAAAPGAAAVTAPGAAAAAAPGALAAAASGAAAAAASGALAAAAPGAAAAAASGAAAAAAPGAAAAAASGAAAAAAPGAAAAAASGAAAAAAPGAAAAAASDAAAAAAPGAAAAAAVATPMVADDDDDDEEFERCTQMAERAAAADATRASVGALPLAGDDDARPGYTAGGNHDGGQDDDAAELRLDDVRAARAAAAAAAAAIHDGPQCFGCDGNVKTPLDKVPAAPIRDVFSSVLGDVFHMMDRPKVPMHHSSKKGYFVALQEAW